MDMIVEIHVKNCYLETWASAKIFPGGGNVDIFVYQNQVAIDAMHTDVHKAAYLVYTTKKIPHVAATVTKMRFVCRNSQIYCNNLHNRLQTVFKTRVILFKETLPWSDFILRSKWTFEDLWPSYCCLIKTNRGTTSLQVSRTTFAGKVNRYEWTVTLQLRNTRGINLALRQSECHIAK